MAVTAVTQKGISIALACRTFGLSETCYRYTRKLNDENVRIADLLECFRKSGNRFSEKKHGKTKG